MYIHSEKQKSFETSLTFFVTKEYDFTLSKNIFEIDIKTTVYFCKSRLPENGNK